MENRNWRLEQNFITSAQGGSPHPHSTACCLFLEAPRIPFLSLLILPEHITATETAHPTTLFNCWWCRRRRRKIFFGQSEGAQTRPDPYIIVLLLLPKISLSCFSLFIFSAFLSFSFTSPSSGWSAARIEEGSCNWCPLGFCWLHQPEYETRSPPPLFIFKHIYESMNNCSD